MPIEHRSVGLQSGFMGLPHDVQPAVAVQFLRAEELSDARAEDFGPASRKHLKTCRFQTGENIFYRDQFIFCKMGDFNRCKRFDAGVGLYAANFSQQTLKEGKRQVGMTTAHYVHLGQVLAGGADFIEDFFFGEFERKRIAFFSAKSAEAAVVYADVRVVDVAVYHVVGCISVEPCPGMMSKRAESVHVRAGEKLLPLGNREPRPFGNFVADVFQAEFSKVPWFQHVPVPWSQRRMRRPSRF